MTISAMVRLFVDHSLLHFFIAPVDAAFAVNLIVLRLCFDLMVQQAGGNTGPLNWLD
ncbi:MAG: hypothetical protein L0Z73_04480 [Gammaproteobacteria bacterium]|nr:hypothetical protein [Gammaproteobacteria bacterium]